MSRCQWWKIASVNDSWTSSRSSKLWGIKTKLARATRAFSPPSRIHTHIVGVKLIVNQCQYRFHTIAHHQYYIHLTAQHWTIFYLKSNRVQYIKPMRAYVHSYIHTNIHSRSRSISHTYIHTITFYITTAPWTVIPDKRPTFLTAFAPVRPRVPKTVLACSSERLGFTTRTFWVTTSFASASWSRSCRAKYGCCFNHHHPYILLLQCTYS